MPCTSKEADLPTSDPFPHESFVDAPVDIPFSARLMPSEWTPPTDTDAVLRSVEGITDPYHILMVLALKLLPPVCIYRNQIATAFGFLNITEPGVLNTLIAEHPETCLTIYRAVVQLYLL